MAMRIQYKPFRIVRVNGTDEEPEASRPLWRRLARFGALFVVIGGLAGVSVFMLLRGNEANVEQSTVRAIDDGKSDEISKADLANKLRPPQGRQRERGPMGPLPGRGAGNPIVPPTPGGAPPIPGQGGRAPHGQPARPGQPGSGGGAWPGLR